MCELEAGGVGGVSRDREGRGGREGGFRESGKVVGCRLAVCVHVGGDGVRGVGGGCVYGTRDLYPGSPP